MRQARQRREELKQRGRAVLGPAGVASPSAVVAPAGPAAAQAMAPGAAASIVARDLQAALAAADMRQLLAAEAAAMMTDGAEPAGAAGVEAAGAAVQAVLHPPPAAPAPAATAPAREIAFELPQSPRQGYGTPAAANYQQQQHHHHPLNSPALAFPQGFATPGPASAHPSLPSRPPPAPWDQRQPPFAATPAAGPPDPWDDPFFTGEDGQTHPQGEQWQGQWLGPGGLCGALGLLPPEGRRGAGSGGGGCGGCWSESELAAAEAEVRLAVYAAIAEQLQALEAEEEAAYLRAAAAAAAEQEAQDQAALQAALGAAGGSGLACGGGGGSDLGAGAQSEAVLCPVCGCAALAAVAGVIACPAERWQLDCRQEGLGLAHLRQRLAAAFEEHHASGCRGGLRFWVEGGGGGGGRGAGGPGAGGGGAATAEAGMAAGPDEMDTEFGGGCEGGGGESGGGEGGDLAAALRMAGAVAGAGTGLGGALGACMMAACGSCGRLSVVM
ncbi:hypothetical protein HXX76_009764 [Chlamydomonas incerta]|uniref:RPA-interacting protein C-terminal domain-containing protein n=1 Tax=Chlamydomonas incerta TaxID=51695 RepID=A0A835SSV2_CHLIN|nr:hypothetical protein HXX76_009764 [Chlamydomonas incerta]|eukprot:KAG2431236.1 hypothetical protein HXX76_009764 [Chlamydomonas incerta]